MKKIKGILTGRYWHLRGNNIRHYELLEKGGAKQIATIRVLKKLYSISNKKVIR